MSVSQGETELKGEKNSAAGWLEEWQQQMPASAGKAQEGRAAPELFMSWVCISVDVFVVMPQKKQQSKRNPDTYLQAMLT